MRLRALLVIAAAGSALLSTQAVEASTASNSVKATSIWSCGKYGAGGSSTFQVVPPADGFPGQEFSRNAYGNGVLLGTVSATPVTTGLSLDSVTPSAGWAYQVIKTPPPTIVVQFVSGNSMFRIHFHWTPPDARKASETVTVCTR